jgi:NAD+ kinase
MRIKIIHNPKKEWAKELSTKLQAFLKDEHEIVENKPDYTICIGGDGTILYANHSGMLEGKLIGIGGRSSYICQLSRDHWRDEIKKTLESVTEKIMLLEGVVRGKKFRAINDFVIHAPDYRVIDIDLKVNKETYSYRGDGIIISSSVGSTGYAYSAGGQTLAPAEKKMQVVPICPYRRKIDSMILDKDAKIEISADREAALIVDGIFTRHLKDNEKITISSDGFLEFASGVGKHGF